ncbi:NRDE family protein [Bacillus sp. 31A1R]|uniref:NRDE family protein n=1 Tax=Robertmurraya mangrovi TaxID=3098077 RepID=A0ABU5IWN1_9BACI|nr:NRDE family protein [Bacillus sp. 31A1R]MDZ5471540.1 NRDE family protein [Bacillus sp. 31A1R]
MCLILFAYQIHPEFDLIVASNRDEFYDRPTAPAHFWENQQNILAGKDLLKQGTWLGVTKSGRFAALTNYRNPSEVVEGKRSRGELVADFLKGKQSAYSYVKEKTRSRDLYPGYNLVVSDGRDLYYYSNQESMFHKLTPGIYGLSNHLINTEWPKVTYGREKLGEIIKGEMDTDEPLFQLLKTSDPAPDELLPSTGVSLEWERILSPLFIESETYGTRCSTIVKFTNNEVIFSERIYTRLSMTNQNFCFTIDYAKKVSPPNLK